MNRRAADLVRATLFGLVVACSTPAASPVSSMATPVAGVIDPATFEDPNWYNHVRFPPTPEMMHALMALPSTLDSCRYSSQMGAYSHWAGQVLITIPCGGVGSPIYGGSTRRSVDPLLDESSEMGRWVNCFLSTFNHITFQPVGGDCIEATFLVDTPHPHEFPDAVDTIVDP